MGLTSKITNTMRRFRTAFVTGVLVLVPLMATIDILRWFIRSADNATRGYLPAIPDFPGLGLIIVLILIFITGALTQNYIGQWVVSILDSWIKRITFVGGIYGAIKKFLETVFNPRSDKFSGVVLVQFPREGIYSIGFRTGKPDHKIMDKQKKNLVSVFVPCTPNPTSGFYLMVPDEDLVTIDMTVQEAFKTVISMGMVTSDEQTENA